MKLIRLDSETGEQIRDFAVRMLNLSYDKTAIVKGVHNGRRLRVVPASTIDNVLSQWNEQAPPEILPFKFCPHCGERILP